VTAKQYAHFGTEAGVLAEQIRPHETDNELPEQRNLAVYHLKAAKRILLDIGVAKALNETEKSA